MTASIIGVGISSRRTCTRFSSFFRVAESPAAVVHVGPLRERAQSTGSGTWEPTRSTTSRYDHEWRRSTQTTAGGEDDSRRISRRPAHRPDPMMGPASRHPRAPGPRHPAAHPRYAPAAAASKGEAMPHPRGSVRRPAGTAAGRRSGLTLARGPRTRVLPVFVPDHFGDQLAPVPALTAAADATTRCGRHARVRQRLQAPRRPGQGVATLDVLSGGGLELGIGAGWMTSDYDQSGIPMDPPGPRRPDGGGHLAC